MAASILAPLPVQTTPVTPVDPNLETRSLAFRAIDGTELFPGNGREFVGMNGMTGMDYPPVETTEDQIPGQHGSRLLHMRYAARDITIPLWLRTDSDHRAFLNNRARLFELFDFDNVDYQAEGGTFDLVSNSLDGNNERSLRCHYLGGAEGNLTRDTDTSLWAMLPLKLRAVQPFWQGDEWRSPDIRRPIGVNFFERFPLRLSNSRALGSNITVKVPGTARCWPQINVIGPCSSVQVTGPNLYISVPNGVDEDEVLIIETDPALRSEGTVFNDDPDWSRIAPNCVFGSGLRPGDNTFSIDCADATADTVAWVAGIAQWKTPW